MGRKEDEIERIKNAIRDLEEIIRRRLPETSNETLNGWYNKLEGLKSELRSLMNS